MRRELARIESTSLGFEGHGIFTATLHVNYGGSSQGVGGWNLTRVAGTYIPAVLRVCGVDRWEDVKGKTIYVLFADDAKSGYIPLGIEALPMDGSERMVFSDFVTI